MSRDAKEAESPGKLAGKLLGSLLHRLHGAGPDPRQRVASACVGTIAVYTLWGELRERYMLPGWSPGVARALVNTLAHAGAASYGVLATLRHLYEGPLALGSKAGKSLGASGGWRSWDTGIAAALAALFMLADFIVCLGAERHSLATAMVVLLMASLSAALPHPMSLLLARAFPDKEAPSSPGSAPQDGGAAARRSALGALGASLALSASIGLLPAMVSLQSHDSVEAVCIAGGIALLAALHWQQPPTACAGQGGKQYPQLPESYSP